MLLTREQILEIDDLKSEIVAVPEWGGEVRVKTMSGYERDKFEQSISGKNGGVNLTNIRAKLAAQTIVDESGKLVFNEDDITKLGKKSCSALDRVLEAAKRMNHLNDKDVEDLAKN